MSKTQYIYTVKSIIIYFILFNHLINYNIESMSYNNKNNKLINFNYLLNNQNSFAY